MASIYVSLIKSDMFNVAIYTPHQHIFMHPLSMAGCKILSLIIVFFITDGPDRETLLEKVLYNCECIKVAVINILEAHAQGQDSQHGVCTYLENLLFQHNPFLMCHGFVL